MIPCQSPGSSKEPPRSCLAGKSEDDCLVPGKEQGLVGFKGLLRVGEHTSEGSRAVYTLSSHFGCLLQVLCLYLRSAEAEEKGDFKNYIMNVPLDNTTAGYWQFYL